MFPPDSPSLTWAGLKPSTRALGAPHSVLIITLCRGWYQKSYPKGAASPGCSQLPTTSNVSPSSRMKPPERMTAGVTLTMSTRGRYNSNQHRWFVIQNVQSWLKEDLWSSLLVVSPLPLPDGSPKQLIMIWPLPRQWLVWGFARPHFQNRSIGSTIWRHNNITTTQ